MTIHLPRIRARRTDPRTSHDAADSITEETLFNGQDEVLFLLGEQPSAHHELVARHQHDARLFGYRPLSESRIRTACKELVEKGLVHAIGGTLTPSGRHAYIWALTEETK